MSIRIFLIDEHRSARESLARRLASMPGLDVVGSTCDGEAAIRDLIQEVLADCGVFRVSGPVPDEPSDPCPEFVQIELPRPDNEDN